MIRSERLPLVFAFVFTTGATGCSLLWDMDPYERGEKDARNGERVDRGDVGDPSEGSSGSTGTAPAEDAGRMGEAGSPGCHSEIEPNNASNTASELRAGRTCARIDGLTDLDFWSVVGPATVTITLASGMIVTTQPGDTSQPQYFDEAGPATVSFGAGTHLVVVQPLDYVGEYEIER